MELFLLALAPLVVNFATQGIKKLQAIQLTTNKKLIIRFIAVVCSFVAVLLGGIVSGEMIDESTLTTFIEMVAVFFASQVTYFLAKKKG